MDISTLENSFILMGVCIYCLLWKKQIKSTFWQLIYYNLYLRTIYNYLQKGFVLTLLWFITSFFGNRNYSIL